MKYAWLGCLLVGSQLFAGTQDSEFNVNTRYTVETVVVSGDGWTSNLGTDPHSDKISSILRRDILALIGEQAESGGSRPDGQPAAQGVPCADGGAPRASRHRPPNTCR